MSDLTLHDLPDDLIRQLNLRAEATGRSVEEAAREALERGLLLDVRGRVAVANRIRAMTPKPIDDDSTQMIRRLRDGS
jgi:plasmid stability protein